MNLQKLFKAQKQLDDHIVKEKGLEEQDLLDKKILALQVELGELANEWEMFKFWKENPEPRNYCMACEIPEVEAHDCHNPLLEEYVDCLHFILGIGIYAEFRKEALNVRPHHAKHLKQESITKMFNSMFEAISQLHYSIRVRFFTEHSLIIAKENYEQLFSYFLLLGIALGFTWQEIEQAYFEKWKINFERQANGY